MDNEKYLFKLQEEYLQKSKVYIDSLREGKILSELSDLAYELRCLLSEIKALKQDIERNKNG